MMAMARYKRPGEFAILLAVGALLMAVLFVLDRCGWLGEP